ncbi:Fic family protein [Roseateles sp. L2-2]|uniref:Fic family protein n=1 Tax=Roseateles TaxID=93681 RepID=UPI003D35F150
MIGNDVGYSFLMASMALATVPLERPARVARVKVITRQLQQLGIPASVAPRTEEPVEHLLFALRHEGVKLHIAMPALRRIPAEAVGDQFVKTPSSRFARLACYLWEIANEQALDGLPPASGKFEKVFDESEHLTDRRQRNLRWRIDFNGIGSPRYCVTVRRSPIIQTLLQEDLLAQVAEFASSLDEDLLSRALHWAYLSETDSSYAIEREHPTHDRSETFVQLLSRAHDRELISEDYLVSLQNLMVASPLNKAFCFRAAQNRLRNSSGGALGITYLPPPPKWLPDIMESVMAIGNDTSGDLDPLVRASIVKFAFVFAHPFMDGNGRVSRFLFHKVACSDPRLANGFVFPVSTAMSRNEADYLRALQSFARPLRQLWDLRMIGDDDFEERFLGESDAYRYWDATACVEFCLRMAQEALHKDLYEESEFLKRFDAIYRAVNRQVDLNNNDMVLLVRSIATHGSLSRNRYRQLVAKGNPPATIDAAVQVAAEVMGTIKQ